MDLLTFEEIETVAENTKGQSMNADWRNLRKGKLTSSMFGRVLSVAASPSESNVEKLRADLFTPKKLDYIPAIKWGIAHEAQAITAYAHDSKTIVKPTGIWLYPNGVMGASPDGLVYNSVTERNPAGILEVKCPYSLRNTVISDKKQWHEKMN